MNRNIKKSKTKKKQYIKTNRNADTFIMKICIITLLTKHITLASIFN